MKMILWSVLWGAALTASANSAFNLVKEGNRYVGEQSKDKVVQIRSEKSENLQSPAEWSVVYYDPTATLKAVEVKFAGDQMQSVKRPLRLLEPVSGNDIPLDQTKLKVDSDAALKTALADPILEHVKVVATRMKLEGMGQGVLNRSDVTEPVWKIKLWAAKTRKPGAEADIGEIWVSAADGKTVSNDLHLKNVD